MKILLLSPWFPSPAFGGALIRVFETLRHLARSHRVMLLAPVHRPPQPEHLRAVTDLGVEVVTVSVSDAGPAAVGRLTRGLCRGRSLLQGLHYDVGMARELQRLTALHSFDVIHVEHSFMAPYLAWISPRSSARTVLSMHNIESVRFRREAQVAGWSLRRAALAADEIVFGSWEKRAVQQFDGIAAVSRAEEVWARNHAPAAAVGLVPNGVSVEHFRPVEGSSPARTIVFSGLMNYPPNVDAVVWFAEEVLPLIRRRHPEVRFSIVGDKPTRAVRALDRHEAVDVTGRVPDVRPYLTNATAVVPLRSGAGTRLKILEAMAMQRPVVATRIGAEGLDVTSGANILIGDSPAELATHVCALLDNPELAARLGRAGRRLVQERYDWRLCLRNLDRLYDAVAGSRVVQSNEAFVAVAQ